LPYRWPRSLAMRVGHGAREGDMSKRLPNGLAWTLLGLTLVVPIANVVLDRLIIRARSTRASGRVTLGRCDPSCR
jgi:hypothetical protein